MRTTWLAALAYLALAAASAGLAAEGPALDAAKYPQETPQQALRSLIKALEARDFSYWISFLIVPADTKRLVERHGSLEKAAQANADEKLAPRLRAQVALLKEMLAGKAPAEGEDHGAPCARFQVGQTVLQLEKQADGRWCMNTGVTAAK